MEFLTPMRHLLVSACSAETELEGTIGERTTTPCNSEMRLTLSLCRPPSWPLASFSLTLTLTLFHGGHLVSEHLSGHCCCGVHQLIGPSRDSA